MKSIFNYDSPLMQVLGFIADLFILNILFILCCLPIVTIGAAQAGLYYGVRPLRDPEDDRSCAKLFFKGFAKGFWTITPVWLLFLVFEAILAYSTAVCFENAATGLFVHWAIPGIGLIFAMILHSLTTVFHAQFSCSRTQLFRNSFILFLTNPFHSILVGVLTWFPVGLFGLRLSTFMDLIPLFMLVYYSVAMLISATVMKKPFQRLIDHANGDDIDLREEEAETAV